MAEPYSALLKVDGIVVALNESAKQFEEVLGSIVEEHSYAGFPLEVFGDWLIANRPGSLLTAAAHWDGALYVIVQGEE